MSQMSWMSWMSRITTNVLNNYKCQRCLQMSFTLESRVSLRNNTRRTALASPTTAAKIPPEIRPPARLASPARASRPRPAITCAPSTPSRPPAHRRARTDIQRPQKLAATDFCFSFVLANGGRAGVSVCRRRSGGGVAWVASVWGGRRSVWRGCISAVCSVGALV